MLGDEIVDQTAVQLVYIAFSHLISLAELYFQLQLSLWKKVVPCLELYLVLDEFTQ